MLLTFRAVFLHFPLFSSGHVLRRKMLVLHLRAGVGGDVLLRRQKFL